MKVHNLLVTGSHTSSGEDIRLISSSVATINNAQNARLNSIESITGSLVSKTGSFATTGSNIFIGTQTVSGSIIPAVDNAYDLGSVTHQFRDLYLSSASLYIDGTKVLSSTTQELQITTDAGQSFKILEAGSDTITLQSNDGNITLATSGGGDVIMDPTNGIIALKGTTTIYAGNRILSSDGNAIQFGNSVTMTGSLVVTGFIETQELRTTYISSSILYRSGSTKFGDELDDTHSFTGSLSVSGSISVPGSGLVSGSSQITYSGLSGIPSGIISGSAQLPSGLVSGSVQVDVMSTTNIARLATTGSNTFTGTLNGTSATFSGGIQINNGQFYNAKRADGAGINILGIEAGGNDLISVTAGNYKLRNTGGGDAANLLMINSAGSLGLGVTPSAWNIGSPVIQMGTGVHFFGAGIQAQMGSNNFYNGTNYIYSSSNFASRYLQNNGNHIWENAPSGTSGNTITFNSAMTLDVSGNLSVARSLTIFSNGGTSPVLAIRQTNAVDQGYDFETEDVNVGRLDLYGKTSGGRVQMMTWIKANGRVGIGAIAPRTKLQVTPVSNAEIPVLGTATGVATFTSANTNYGLQFNSTSDGSFHIQSQRFDNSATAYSLILNYAGGNIGIGEKTAPGCSLDVSSRTDAIALPRGTTAQRPGSSIAGMGRFNTEISKTEFYNGTVWVAIGGAGDGSTSSSAASSAKAIKAAVGNPTSGVYWLQIPNVNSGNAFQCYCDFTMDGGIGYAIIYNQSFEGPETGPSHASFGSSTISTAGFNTEYQIAPTAMISNYGVTKLAVFARTGGSSGGGITGATYFNWVAFTGPTTTQYNLIFTNGYNDTQFTGTFNSSDGNTGTARFPNSHGNTGGVTQITNGTTVNDNILYEYKQGAGTDPNHFWMVGNGRTGDVYWAVNNRYGSGTGNVMYNRWGGVALY
jgi:hypothetical protein